MSTDTKGVTHSIDAKRRQHERAEAVRVGLAGKATAMEAVADRYARVVAQPDGTLSADEKEMIERDMSQHLRNAANLREAITWPD